MRTTRRNMLTGLAGAGLSVREAAGAAPTDFYRGKTINVIVGFAPGGAVDASARVVARHLPRFIPGNPRVISQNMEGAAGIVSANYLYSRAAPDGLTLGIPGRSWFVEGAIQVAGVRYNPSKFSFVGSPGAVNSVVYVRTSTGVKTYADLKNAKRKLNFGALGNLAPTAIVPFLLAANGMPVNVILGYVSSARVILALEQGEVDGFFTVETAIGLRKELVDKKIIVPILQNKRVHEGVPLLSEVLPAGDAPILNVVMAFETFGLPVIAPPGVASERVDILRSAFAAMCADKEYLAEADKADMPVGMPIGGAELNKMMDELVATATPAVIARYKRLGTPV